MNPAVLDSLEKLGWGLLGWLLGFASAEVRDWLARLLHGPKLRLELDPTLTPAWVQGHSSPALVVMYVRVGVVNSKRRLARNCRAYLTRVEEWDDSGGRFRQPFYDEAMPLIWSYDRGTTAADVPKDVRRYFDVLEIRRDRKGVAVQFWHSSQELFGVGQYAPFFGRYGLFRYTVTVGADDASPARKRFTVNWNGNWPPTVQSD